MKPGPFDYVLEATKPLFPAVTGQFDVRPYAEHSSA